MRNFFRASRQVFRYRGTVALSVASSMMVAVLWGGNIGALYPIFEISLRGQSLQTWVEQEIAASDARVKEIGEKLGVLESQEAGALRRSAQREIQHLRARQAAEVRALATYRRLRPYIQRFLPDDPFRTVVVIVVCLIVATAVKGAFVVVNMMATASAVQRTTADLQQQYFRHVTGMDLARYHQLGISQLMAHFNQATEGLRNGMMSLYGASIREPLKIVVCVIGAAWISWRLLAFTFLLAPLAALMLRLLARRIRDTMSLDLGDAVQLNRSVIEAVRGLPIVQAFTMQEYEVAKVDRACRQRMRKSIRVRLYIALTKPVMEVLGIVAISVALLCGMYLVLNQETQILGITLTDRPLSVSAMLVFFGLLVGMNEPARKLSDVFSRLQVGSAAADRIYSVLDMQPTIKDPADPRPLRRPLKQLVFDNVHFHYHPSQPVLQGVDLCIEQGQRIAIVGANGSGKTTLVNMILRFYDPTQGAVRWGDVDLRQASLLDLRGRVGLMTQQPMLMDDTVANNIRYGSPGATFEQVVAAAQLAQAHQFIESKLANGYDTVLGHDSHRLSGGQRQRIALARALLRKPEVLILDEATSQLDQQTERQIHESAAQFMQDCTTLIVTHRPLTLELADRIIVMDGGQIVDSGTRAELISRSRLFQQLLGPSQQRAA